VSAIRKVVHKSLAPGFKEAMNWGMICYEVPLSVYPDTYNGQPLMLAAIAAQKSHLGVYLTCASMDPASERALRDGYKERGMKLDMGKSCIRAKKLEDLALDVIGKVIGAFTVKKFVAQYEKSRGRKLWVKGRSGDRRKTGGERPLSVARRIAFACMMK
jgi:hypothetical protein